MCHFIRVLIISWTFPVLLGFDVLAGESLVPYDLRCDEMVDPSGIDVTEPRLSWKLKGEGRGRKQSAYRVMVASRASLLQQGEADLWDSGKQASAQQNQIPYGGAPLASGQRVFWAVQVWGETEEPSALSSVAAWTMGIVREEDWGAARWIAHPEWLKVNRERLGYRSLPAESVDSPKWIQLDLGADVAIDTVKLHALRHTVAERLGFPTCFKVEVTTDAAMDRATTLVDYTETPYTNSWATRHTVRADGVVGRFLRITAPVLRDLNGEICLAFSQIEVLSDGRNLALGSVVTASDSVETGMWADAAVVDGKGVPGSNPLGTKTAILRREFAVRSGVKRAVLHVTGLGQYVAYLNGQRIGKDLLSPGWTNTDKTILYDTRDVTRLIRSGGNAIGLSLASGMYSVYHPGERYTKFEGRFRPLMAIAKLDIEYEDGSTTTLVSDTSWKANFGPITYSHVYGGEDYDARMEPDGWTESGCDDGDWPQAALAPAPEGALKGASFAAPPIRAVETLAAKTIHPLAAGVEVYDLGQNAALMPRLSVSGPRGSKVRITPAELLKKDGSVDRASSAHGAKDAYWEYTLSGEDEIERWRPEFFYHGARYLQVERLPAAEGGSRPEVASMDAWVTHSSAAPIGDFACSSELFNRTRDLIRWAQRSNLASVITDCPHRERLGWLEQYHLNGPSLRYEFELNRLFMKTFGDMVDAQTTEGLVPDIAPEYIKFEGGFRDSPEWGSALILAAWQQYLWSGDDTVFRRYYPEMESYVAYLGSKADKHILSHGLGDWYDLGPGRPGFAQLTPVSVTATATYYEDVLVLRNVARLMGWEDKALQYQDLADAIKTAFVTELFDEESGSFGRESQTGNAMAYVLDLCPPGGEEAVLNAIIADVKRRGNAFTSGDVGHRYLLMALAKGGRSDIIYAMHSERDRPGYGWQLDHGATSLTEAWDANRHASQNHFMLGHIMEWFYGGLAGIAPDPEAPGFRNVIVKPQLVAGIDWAQARFESIRGPISVRWERRQAAFEIEVSLAPNMTADVYVPINDVKKIYIDGKPADQVEGVGEIVSRGDSQLLPLASGEWKIEVRWCCDWLPTNATNG